MHTCLSNTLLVAIHNTNAMVNINFILNRFALKEIFMCRFYERDNWVKRQSNGKVQGYKWH